MTRCIKLSRKEALSRTTCRHPQHLPGKRVNLSPGDYQHRCPECGALTFFRVRQVVDLVEDVEE